MSVFRSFTGGRLLALVALGSILGWSEVAQASWSQEFSEEATASFDKLTVTMVEGTGFADPGLSSFSEGAWTIGFTSDTLVWASAGSPITFCQFVIHFEGEKTESLKLLIEAFNHDVLVCSDEALWDGNLKQWSIKELVGDCVRVVPESSTMIAGALLLLPFGASAIRILRKNRQN